MAFDGIVVKALVTDFQKYLIGAKVNKVLQPNKSEITLNLYNHESFALNICIHPDYYRICLTDYLKPNPVNSLNFCMLLRKYLTGSKIINIESFDLDRIICITFKGNNELKDVLEFSLIIELMGRRSNIVLINNKGFIIDAIKHIVTSDREILPARSYIRPSSNKKSFLMLNSFDEFYSIISNTFYESLVNCLCNNFIGFSNAFIENVLKELDIDINTKDVNELHEVYDYIKSLISELGSENVSIKSVSKDFVICLETSDININHFIDNYYHNKEAEDIFNNAKSNLSKLILATLKKSSKKLDNINKKLKSCDNMDTYRLYGELLTANLYKFSNYNTALPEITVENYYDNNSLITIPLDTSISYSKNAERFYKKYNKLKNTLAIVSIQKQETELELKYIESIIFSISNAKSLEDLEEIHNEFTENIQMKKYNYKSFQKINNDKSLANNLNKIIINNYDVYIGKNNKQNDYLSLHFASKSDMWFHAQGFHGAHVILKTNGKLPDEDTLFKCALLAKQNCKAALERNVSVDYTYIKYVKKHPSGKTGMVTYTNYKTIIVP